MHKNANKPLVSVLTPTWNRADYLERVWRGLIAQTFKNFEWIVADDGSTDNTQAVVKLLADKSDFSVTLISASLHIGKATMDNRAVACARGHFILWNDSDDYLLPDAIESLVDSWNRIPHGRENEYVGVLGLCALEGGEIVSNCPQSSEFDSSLNDLTEIHSVTGDMTHLTLASVLKSRPFPEVDLVVPEGVVWSSLGEKMFRIRPDVVKINEYGSRHAISFSGLQQYCRGRAYAIAATQQNRRAYRRGFKQRAWTFLTFIRCSFIGEVSPAAQLRVWGDRVPLIVWFLSWPVGGLLACLDMMRGNVRRTHREFLAASTVVTYRCERL